MEEQRCKGEEERLKRKMDEKKSGAAPPPVKKPKSMHGLTMRLEGLF